MLTLDSQNGPPQSRRWLCTLHIEEEPLCPPPAPDSDSIPYAIGQLERCPTTGRLHWQFFVVLRVKRRLNGVKSALKQWLGDHAASTHLESARGTVAECRDYCSKLDTRVGFSFEYGTPPVVQRRGSDLLALFRTGARLDPQDPAWDDVLLRYSLSRLTELSLLVHPRQRDCSVPPVLEVHYGPPGTGKSRRIFQSFPEAYPKPSGKWWDYYNLQETVVLDDFDGCMLSFGDFKRVVDRYPTYVQVKGSTIPLLATRFIITTNVYPSHWWSLKITGSNGRDAIWRRITRVFIYSVGGEDPVERSPSDFRASELFGLELLDPKGDK